MVFRILRLCIRVYERLTSETLINWVKGLVRWKERKKKIIPRLFSFERLPKSRTMRESCVEYRDSLFRLGAVIRYGRACNLRKSRGDSGVRISTFINFNVREVARRKETSLEQLFFFHVSWKTE